jgi:hypothetical protein
MLFLQTLSTVKQEMKLKDISRMTYWDDIHNRAGFYTYNRNVLNGGQKK